MNLFRDLIGRNRGAAMLLIAASLMMKALVPAGYMIAAHSAVLTVELCGGSGATSQTVQIALPGKFQPAPGVDKAAKACPFTALSAGGLAGDLSVAIAVALAFVLALGLARRHFPVLQPAQYLRPPLRAPPLTD